MPTDWPATLLSSGITGAAAGGLISWIFAPQTINRQERGRTQTEARKAMRAIVVPVLTQVRLYQAEAGPGRSRDEDGAMHGEDITLCGQIFTASANLPRWRRRRVQPAAKRLFGTVTVEACGVHGEAAGDPNTAMYVWFVRSRNALKKPERHRNLDKGQFDIAFRSDPDSWRVEALKQQLIRLADCR